MTDPQSAPRVIRRLVVGFHDAAGSSSALEATVRLARTMESQLLGIFVEDAPLLEWSSSPLTRQVGGGVRPGGTFTPDTLAADFATAAAMMRERLARLAGGVGLTAGFRVARTSASSLDFDGREPGDLLVVVEPTDPMARLSYPFAGLLQTIARTSVPVLYMPHRVLQRRGPVVSIAPRPDDPGQRLAAEVAATIGEDLLNVPPPAHGSSPGVGGPLSLQDLSRALSGVRERLLVLSRPTLPADDPCLFASIATQRMVPTLVAGTGKNGDPTA